MVIIIIDIINIVIVINIIIIINIINIINIIIDVINIVIIKIDIDIDMRIISIMTRLRWEGDFYRGKNTAVATTNNCYLAGECNLAILDIGGR